MARSARKKKQPQTKPVSPNANPRIDADPSIEELALELLQDRDFFGKVRDAVERGGLVGEVKNSQATYVGAMSSLLERPLNTIVKGPSSGGKNFLATRVLRLFPKTAIREITSSSETAWNYSAQDFRHRIVYLQERNDASGAIHPVRLLISEGQLTRIVTVMEGGQWVKKEFVAEGPISAISTSTRDRLQIDDETRHVSLWIDDSIDQNRRVVKGLVSPPTPLSKDEIRAWHEAYELVAKRASVPIELPEWFENIAENVYVDDIRVRRYFPAFLEAVRTIALIRSFQQHPENYEAEESITAKFTDYALAAYIFDDVFVESLNRGDDDRETAKTIETIASTQDDEPVDAQQFAEYLGITYDKASAKLRSAFQAGVIAQANSPEKNNNKRYLPAKPARFVPDPKEVFKDYVNTNKPIELTHPVTGKRLRFVRN